MSEATGRIELRIAGMHCSSCAMAIDMGLESVAGVAEARTNYARATTVVIYDPARVAPAALLGAIREAGYAAEPRADDPASGPPGDDPPAARRTKGFFRRRSRG